MPEPIKINIPNPQEATPALLDDPEFRSGFAMGIETYLGLIEEHDRPLTTQEACQELRHDLDPRVRRNGYVLGALTYEIGFLAGWIAAHAAATPLKDISPNS